MFVVFRSLEDGSHVSLNHVARLTVRADKYEILYLPGFLPRVEVYHFRFYSLFGVSHEDI